MHKTEIEEAIEFLRELDHILESCCGNTEIIRRTENLALALAEKDSTGGQHGKIRLNVADAISRAYARTPLAHLQKRDRKSS